MGRFARDLGLEPSSPRPTTRASSAGAPRGSRDRPRADPQPRCLGPTRTRSATPLRLQPARGRGPPLGRRRARGVAPHVRHPRPLRGQRSGPRRRRLPRGARAPARRCGLDDPRRPAGGRPSRAQARCNARDQPPWRRYLSGLHWRNGLCIVGDGIRMFLRFRPTQAGRECRHPDLSTHAGHAEGRCGALSDGGFRGLHDGRSDPAHERLERREARGGTDRSLSPAAWSRSLRAPKETRRARADPRRRGAPTDLRGC